MASSCSSSVTFPLKCSITANTSVSISNSSVVGLSGKLEQLESPSSVSDLSDFTRLDEYFHFLQSAWDTNLVPTVGAIKNFTFLVISYLVFTGRAYPNFLPLWIVIGISRVFNKTLTQRPLLVIKKDFPKTAHFDYSDSVLYILVMVT